MLRFYVYDDAITYGDGADRGTGNFLRGAGGDFSD